MAGHARFAATDVVVSPEGIRLRGMRDAALGEALRLTSEGGATLVTAVNEDGILFAKVAEANQAVEAKVSADWGPRVHLAALAPGGEEHHRLIEVQPGLTVRVTTEPASDGTVAVEARVTDGLGRPVKARVSLSAWDQQLAAREAPLSEIKVKTDASMPAQHLASSVTVPFTDGDLGAPIASALRQEVRRLAERQRARRAGQGRLADNALMGATLEELTVSEVGLGGLGASGTGYGAGGGGFGQGGVRKARGRFVDVQIGPPPGVRRRSLWSVQDTGRDGVVRAVLDGPPAHWTVRATAVADEGVGQHLTEVDTRNQVWLLAEEPSAGFPGDRAQPTVTVVNGTDAVFDGVVQIGDTEVPVSLEAGAARTLRGELRSPGPATVPIEARSGEATVAEAGWRFPLAGGVAKEAGPIVTVHVGPRGGFPFRQLVAQPDPGLAQEPWRHAHRGRIALLGLGMQDDPVLRRVMRDARDVLRATTARPTPRDAAHEVMFLAELPGQGVA